MLPAVALCALLVPPVAGPAVRVTTRDNGYQVALSRPAAERLRDALDRVQDEKGLADAVRDAGKQLAANDPDPEAAAARVEVIALMLSGQLPQLKKALHERMGEYGVTIRVWGLQRERVLKRDRPRLRRAVEAARAALPDDARETVDALIVAARTTPLTWKVDPRD
jgi:hypothetical protein